MNGDSSICNKCGKSEPEVTFALRLVGGRQYPKYICRSCDTKRKQIWRRSRGRTETIRLSAMIRQRRERTDREQIPRVIVVDCRRSDKKKGFVCDLTIEFVKESIKDGCSYCGEIRIRVGLDRIDNALGHSQNNVVACCGRCNYLRRDMPYAAWMMLVPQVRKIRESGAFGDWDGFGRYRKGKNNL